MWETRNRNLRHHYGARKLTLTLLSLLKFLSKRIFWLQLCEKSVAKLVKIFQKCCLVFFFLVFCTKLYINLAVCWCSSSHFFFLLNFRMTNALVLKTGTLSLSCLFSKFMLANFDNIFRSKVIHLLYRKMGQNWLAGVFFNIPFFNSDFKNSEQGFFPQILLAEETKTVYLAKPIFNLKAIEFAAFFAYFHLFRHLIGTQIFQSMAKHLIFNKLSDKKKVWQ